jgi:hypothetical protein
LDEALFGGRQLPVRRLGTCFLIWREIWWAVKEVVELLGTILVAAHMGLMVDSQIPAILSRTFLV